MARTAITRRLGTMDLTFAFASDKDAPAAARAALTRVEDLVDEEIVDRLRYIVTELVSNAVVHGPGGEIRLSLRVTSPARISGEVVDHGNGRIAIRDGDPDAPDARGLKIVDGLATRWGVREGSAKVWFELER
jgi:anti-sigma regulatory factor (Ser/Thr protein kinase)